MDLEARVAAEKGAPLDDAERAILAERAAVARAWLDGFAPERYRSPSGRTCPRRPAT